MSESRWPGISPREFFVSFSESTRGPTATEVAWRTPFLSLVEQLFRTTSIHVQKVCLDAALVANRLESQQIQDRSFNRGHDSRCACPDRKSNV